MLVGQVWRSSLFAPANLCLRATGLAFGLAFFYGEMTCRIHSEWTWCCG